MKTAVMQEISQAEDRAMKLSAQFFAAEMLRRFHVDGKVKEVFATELNYVEFKRLFQDFNYLMEDGSCCHFEFESDGISKDDLRRFRVYESVTSYTYRKPVTTYVVCSADVKHPISILKEGINEYRVNMIRLKDSDADRVFRQMEKKKAAEVTRDDLLDVVLTPLMSGETEMRERIRKGFGLLEQEYPCITDEDRNKMQAILYLFALKFLGRNEVERMEDLRMTYFAKMMQEEGFAKGVNQGQVMNVISQVIKKVNKGKTLKVIAEELESEEDMIRRICDLVEEHKNKSLRELAELYLNAA